MYYKYNHKLVLQKLDRKFVGFDPDRSFLYTFNSTAEFVFKKIKLKWDEDRIVAAMAKIYDAPVATIKKDVRAIIKDMVKHKILTPLARSKR